MKYKKITKNDVLKELISVDLDIMSPVHCITLVNIASLLKTSRYQVKKHMDVLVNEGIAVLINECLRFEDYIRPYNGYTITDTVKIQNGNEVEEGLNYSVILKAREMYQREKDNHEKLIRSIWN